MIKFSFVERKQIHMKKFMIGVVVLMFLLLTGCSNSKSNSEFLNNPYSRESVNYMSEGCSFGSGRSEDIDVALKYLYESNEISEIYGDSFQITGDKIICHKSESRSFFLSGIYKGEAIYEFVFDDSSYKISLSKNYLGKWTVDSCEQSDY